MKRPTEVYVLFGLPPHFAGFDILHEPVDGEDCEVDEHMQCKKISHLQPIAPVAGEA